MFRTHVGRQGISEDCQAGACEAEQKKTAADPDLSGNSRAFRKLTRPSIGLSIVRAPSTGCPVLLKA